LGRGAIPEYALDAALLFFVICLGSFPGDVSEWWRG
jgi:hypothetical protein